MTIGVDIPGGDFTRFALSVPDPGLCRQECHRYNQCVAWTFIKPGVQAPQAVCWLKSQAGQRRADGNAISGIKQSGWTPAPGAAQVTGDMELALNFPGADIQGFALPSGDPNLCRHACQARGDCRAWTFVKPGIQGQQAVCWIKGSIPAAAGGDPNVISGRRVGGVAGGGGGGGGGGGQGGGQGGGGGQAGWGVWASASGGQWQDPCAIQYNAAQIAGNRYDANPGYRRVRTRATQQEADLDIDHFGRYHRNQPDGVVKMVPCPSGGTAGGGGGGGGGSAGWTGNFQGGGFAYTISGSGNSLSVSYKASHVTQSGSSTCTVSGNRASCRGSGTYSDSDKTINYADAWEMTLSGDTINYQWRIDQANASWRVTPYQSAVRAGNSGSASMTRAR